MGERTKYHLPMPSPHFFTLPHPLPLERGGALASVRVAYHTLGTLNAARDNVVWVCHALTANSDVAAWWPGFFGPGELYDPARWFVVCANILGSCYGTTGPVPDGDVDVAGTDPVPRYHQFPRLTIRDQVAAHRQLRAHLGLTQIHTLIGGSLGGMQALEWAIAQPRTFRHLVLIATSARHSAWGIAFNEAQRLAIEADPTYHAAADPSGGQAGLRAARATALLSYRSHEAYGRAQTEPPGRLGLDDGPLPPVFRASSYQRHQGDKLVARFNAYAYVTLSHAMDSHHVGRGRGGVAAALAGIRARTLVLGIPSDVLFPLTEQQELARLIPGATFAELPSVYGHDGFLLETPRLTRLISQFYVLAPQLSALN